MENYLQLNKEIANIKRLIWFFFGIVWIGRYCQGLLLHQLHLAPFLSVEADNFYWIWHALQFVEFSIQYYWIGLSLDIILAIIITQGIIGKVKKYTGVLFILLFTNYFICYNSVATHHEHTLVALFFMQFILLIERPKHFVLTFIALRYYVIFIFFSAFLWKMCRGSLFHPQQMTSLLQQQHVEYLISYPNSYYSSFINYLIQQETLANLLWYGGWCLELAFVIGFWTRKWDKLLLFLFLVFFIADYLIMGLCFAEFCIFALVFYPFTSIWQYFNQLENA